MFPAYENRLSLSNRLGRFLWRIFYLLAFRYTPTCPFFWWRRRLLQAFGAKLGRGAIVHPTVSIWAPWNLTMGERSSLAPHVDCYSVDRIVIGDDVTVSQRAFLCTASHDIESLDRRLTTAPIYVGDGAWIFAEAFVAPGVHIAVGAVVAARAVVVKDVEPWTVVGGNPARVLKRRVLRADGAEKPPATVSE